MLQQLCIDWEEKGGKDANGKKVKRKQAKLRTRKSLSGPGKRKAGGSDDDDDFFMPTAKNAAKKPAAKKAEPKKPKKEKKPARTPLLPAVRVACRAPPLLQPV